MILDAALAYAQRGLPVFPVRRKLPLTEHSSGFRRFSRPTSPSKGDVSNFLKNHTAADLLALMQKAPVWKPSTDKLLIPASHFLTGPDLLIEWDLEGV